MYSRITILFFVLSAIACGPKNNYIAGTKINPTDENQNVIARVEEYRIAVENKDAGSLLLMASKGYWEDGGTPKGDDDYGFDGLKKMLSNRFKQAESIRYSMRYVRIRYQPENSKKLKLAFVDVMIDASFTIPDARGVNKRMDKRDQGQLVLEWTGEKWMFLSGM